MQEKKKSAAPLSENPLSENPLESGIVKTKNRVHFAISKCVACPFHSRMRVDVNGTMDKAMGVFCSKVSENGRNKLVYSSEWSWNCDNTIPDWCPLLEMGIVHLDDAHHGGF